MDNYFGWNFYDWAKVIMNKLPLKKQNDMSDIEVIDALIDSKGLDSVKAVLEYKMDPRELYDYYFGFISICECSYEMQCAIFDISPRIYDLYADSYFIYNTSHLRIDEDMQFLLYPKGFDVNSFINSSKIDI